MPTKLRPHIYHMTEAPNWPSIQRRGLLPACGLLRMSGLDGAERERLGRAQRLAHTILPDGVLLRDPRPITPAALTSCLVGLSPREWYAFINARVFFWLDPGRLNRQRVACGARTQVVLTVDADALVTAYRERVALSPINSGNARRRPARRGVATFVPYTEWREPGWTSEAEALGTLERPRSQAPAELTVVGAIPDMMRFVIGVTDLPPGHAFTPADA